MKLFARLDVSSFDFKVCLLNGGGDKLRIFIVTNDLLGTTELRDSILDV